MGQARQIDDVGGMSATPVRRGKAALSSGCESHPATALAGSNRSSYGGNEMADRSIGGGLIAAPAAVIAISTGTRSSPATHTSIRESDALIRAAVAAAA